MFLGQIQVDLSNNPWGLIITVTIVLGVIVLVLQGQQRIKKQREALRLRAEELGWSYSGEDAWQNAVAASFRIIYSYTGQTNQVDWALIYSKKIQRRDSVSVGTSSANYSRNNRQITDRLDWRSDNVSIPNMVLLKYKMPSFVNQLTSMVGVDANTYAEYLLNFGLTESDNKRQLQMPFVVSLLTRSNPFTTQNYGLQSVTFDNPIFEAYAVSNEAAAQVLNPKVLAALENWQSFLTNRYGTDAGNHYLYQPMILFYDGGIILSFDSEQRNPEDYEAIVELGTALVNAQR